MKLLRHPTHGRSRLLWNRRSHTRPLCKHRSIAIAVDELDWNIEVQQTREALTRHRARNHVAPDDYLVYFCSANILKHSLECGEVAMNIIDCSDTHEGPFSYLQGQRVRRRMKERALVVR